MDSGYLKTAPGFLNCISLITNFLAFLCVLISENKESIHAGFLVGVSVLGLLASIAFLLCHIIQVHFTIFVKVLNYNICLSFFLKTMARRIPPYIFAVTQVTLGIFLFFSHWSATSVLLSKYHKDPALVATAVFSYVSGMMHLAHAMLLLKAIKVTQIARQALTYGNSVIGRNTSPEPENEASVAYQKDKEVVLDPTQTVY